MAPLIPVGFKAQSKFDPAMEVVFRHEGGWVCDPDDPGGETNFGISMQAIVKSLKLTPEDLGLPNFEPGCLRALTKDTARLVYFKFFWIPGGFSALKDQRLATKAFDAAVNMGQGNAVRCLQKAINALGVVEVEVDGAMGAETAGAANASDGAQLIAAYCSTLADYYRALAVARPRLAKFLPNWLRRASWTG